MYWDEKAETMDRDELRIMQMERLESTLNRVYLNVPFYRERFEEMKVDPEKVRSFEDIQCLPFTTKADLQAAYPYGFFAVPLREVVRLHASSGTTGMSTVVGYTRNDIKNWSNLVARLLTAGGVTKDDVIQIAFGYGLFTGGFGLHYGAEMVGASVIPSSSGNTKRQIKIMEDFRTTALVCTPSYAMQVAEKIHEMGINVNALSLKFGLFGAEPWSDSMRYEIEEKLKIKATDNYGLSEIMGPGVSGECMEQNGMHINEDHFYVEIINPDTLAPVEPGEVGELVVTTLTKEAFPMIRYRTRDLARLLDEPCPCGRTFKKMSRVMGRSDDMMIIKGVNVFPIQIEHILFEIEHTEPHYQIVIDRVGALDEVTVRVEMSEEMFFDEMKMQRELVDSIKKRLHSELGIGVNVQLVEKNSLERSDGKAVRVIDKRNLTK